MQGKKLTIEYIKEQFKKEAYKLLTKRYINCSQKLDYICPKGHKHSISWDNWKQRCRCPYCAGNIKNNIEFIKAKFTKEDYKLLTNEYVNAHQKLNYICPKGHKHSISWNSFRNGHRCLYCDGQNKPTIEFIRSEFEKEGYELLAVEYKNSHQKLECICNKGHKYNVCWNNWQQGQRCIKCSNRVSKWEIEVKKFLDDLNISYMPNDRTQLINPNTKNSLELDIWMPELNRAVECNGIYWHIDEKRKQCDSIKQQLCKDRNIDLLVVTDKEWNEDIEKCKSKVINFIKN